MQGKSRVFIFTTAFLPMVGGSEIAIDEITKRLPDISFDILVPRYRKDLLRNEYVGLVNIQRIGFGNRFDKYFFPLLSAFRAIALVRSYHPDHILLHSYQASFGALGAVLTKFFTRLPLILTLQEGKKLGAQSWLIKIVRRYIVQQADCATAISTYLLNYAKSIRPDLPITRIPNGIDRNVFYRRGADVLKTKLGLQGTKIVITVSRLVEKNGIADLVAAFSILRSAHPDLNSRLVIIGSGNLLSSLRSQAEKKGISDHVLFLGDIHYSALPEYLSLADVFVRPSHSEGLGNAFLEAMACEVPVVGTPVGGIPDFLRDGETGLLCLPGDPQDVAAKIEKVLTDAVLAQNLKIHGLALVEKEYQWSAIADQFKKVYLSYV